jgi:hypothetical protein
MIDEALSLEALQALSTAIGMILEDHCDEATSINPSVAHHGPLAERLRQAGEDVAHLATAMAVLVRRSGDG